MATRAGVCVLGSGELWKCRWMDGDVPDGWSGCWL